MIVMICIQKILHGETNLRGCPFVVVICDVFYISQFLGVILDTHIRSTMEEREIEDDERMNINLHLRSHPLMSVDLISGEFITNPKVCSQSSIVSSFTLTTIHSFIQKERAT